MRPQDCTCCHDRDLAPQRRGRWLALTCPDCGRRALPAVPLQRQPQRSLLALVMALDEANVRYGLAADRRMRITGPVPTHLLADLWHHGEALRSRLSRSSCPWVGEEEHRG